MSEIRVQLCYVGTHDFTDNYEVKFVDADGNFADVLEVHPDGTLTLAEPIDE